MNVPGDLLPNHEPTELSILSAALIDTDAALAVIELGPAVFFNQATREIAEAIRDVVAAGGDIDAVVVAERLEASRRLAGVSGDGMPDVHAVLNYGGSPGLVGRYAATLRRLARQRDVVHLAGNLSNAAMNGDDERVAALVAQDLAARVDSGETPSIEDVWERIKAGYDPAPPPTVLGRADGRCLLHGDGTVLIFGPGGAGKTMVVQHAVHKGQTSGALVGWFDLDNMGLEQLIGRAALLGIGELMLTSKELSYFDRTSRPSLDALLITGARARAQVYVIDSVVGLLALAGIDSEGDNIGNRAALEHAVDLLTAGGDDALVIFIDHVGLNTGRVRGATAKRDFVDQAVEVQVVRPLGRGKVGQLRLVSRKDRRGWWSDGQAMADITVDATQPMLDGWTHLGNRISVAVNEPATDDQINAARMEVLSQAVESLAPVGVEVPFAAVKKLPGVKSWPSSDQLAVMQSLVATGAIDARRKNPDAPKSPWLLTLNHPYRVPTPDTDGDPTT